MQDTFDIIVSNPPYIPLRDKKVLTKEVLYFDPPLALFRGDDGLDCYRDLTYDIKRLLSPQGIAVLEIGQGQHNAVGTLFQEKGFEILFILKDLAGIERVMALKHRS